ncbi:S1C family serine protease [Luteolibacter marinus]|uniref:S1C family serine protease n=1 Tax=Luteolibacter marinus TaxID=2776705 RepID=UPI001867482C|nr:S1C family serine protease [Luteolibacter marinus]
MLRVDYGGPVLSPGAPLVDGNGRVMAVAHQEVDARSGYALPVEVVRRVVDDVQRGGRVSRGWIGLKLKPESVVPQVTQVQVGSPSAKAGVRAGDVLLEIGARHLEDYADAANAFYFLKPGTPTPVRVRRGKDEIEVSVVPLEQAK